MPAMFPLVAALVAAAADPLIVGGGPSDHVYPWIGSMQPRGFSHYCGAALIKPQWMVTAAHCVDRPRAATTTIRIGTNDRTTGGELVQAAQFIQHPTSDIALIKLAQPSRMTPIPIGAESPAPTTAVRLLGWGQTCARKGCATAIPIGLKQLDTQVIADANCVDFNSGNELCIHGTTTNTACYGDSGGPAIVWSEDRWTLVGATSRSGDNKSTCGTGNAIYEDVVAFKGWIDSLTGSCSGYTGALAAGGSQVHAFNAGSGEQKACLDAPDGVDFDLYLQRWSGSVWVTVAKSDSPKPDEALTYTGPAGRYRYVVVSYSGEGSYQLGFVHQPTPG